MFSPEYIDAFMGVFEFTLTPNGLVVIVEDDVYAASKSQELRNECNRMFGKLTRRQYNDLLQNILVKLRKREKECL